MKKLIYFTLIAFFVMTGASFAWKVTSNGSTGVTPTCDAKTSKNVTIEVKSTAQVYAAAADHSSGDKAYGVTSGSSLVWVKKVGKDAASDDYAPASAASDAATAFSGWSSM